MPPARVKHRSPPDATVRQRRRDVHGEFSDEARLISGDRSHKARAGGRVGDGGVAAFMIRRVRFLTRAAAATLALAVVAAPVQTATANSRVTVDAVYMISIAGWNIARASLDLTVDRRRYYASLFMKPSGVAQIVTAVRTSVAAEGQIGRGRISPSDYEVRAAETDQPVSVDMRMRSGTVTSLRAAPPLKQRPGRVPVTDAHKRGIVDPMSAGLLPISRADGRDACDHTLKIFDGWTRYDVRLYFKGTEQVATEGFSGTIPVCGARWVPVAGHRPQKPEVQYLANNEQLEMSVLPLPNAGVAIPFRVSIGTPNGTILIQPQRMSLSGTGA